MRANFRRWEEVVLKWAATASQAEKSGLRAWAQALAAGPKEVCHGSLRRSDGAQVYYAQLPGSTAVVTYLVDHNERVVTFVAVCECLDGLIVNAAFRASRESEHPPDEAVYD